MIAQQEVREAHVAFAVHHGGMVVVDAIRELGSWSEMSVTHVKVAESLDVSRIGPSHQAGSDSLLTSAAFFKMRQVSLCLFVRDFASRLCMRGCVSCRLVVRTGLRYWDSRGLCVECA